MIAFKNAVLTAMGRPVTDSEPPPLAPPPQPSSVELAAAVTGSATPAPPLAEGGDRTSPQVARGAGTSWIVVLVAAGVGVLLAVAAWWVLER